MISALAILGAIQAAGMVVAAMEIRARAPITKKDYGEKRIICYGLLHGKMVVLG